MGLASRSSQERRPPLSPEDSARLCRIPCPRPGRNPLRQPAQIPLPRGRDGRPMPMQVPLDKVYIRIQATTEKQHRAQEEAEERSLSDRLRGGGKSERFRQETRCPLFDILGEYFYRRGEYEAEQRPEPVDPQEALKKHKRLVILGAPGAGKLPCCVTSRAVLPKIQEVALCPFKFLCETMLSPWLGDNTLAFSEFALECRLQPGIQHCARYLEDAIKNRTRTSGWWMP